MSIILFSFYHKFRINEVNLRIVLVELNDKFILIYLLNSDCYSFVVFHKELKIQVIDGGQFL